MIQIIGNALAIVTALIAWLFVLAYHLSSPWWASEAGRNIMALVGVIAAVLTLAVVRIAGVDSAWFQALRTGVFAATPIVLGHRLWMLWRVQFRGRTWAEIRGHRKPRR